MSRFLTDLDIRLVDEMAGRYKLLAGLVYRSDLLRDEIAVPAGFVTDFASVPRLPFVYMVVGGKGQRAAVVHDWLYTTHQVTRKQADAVLAEALRVCGYRDLVVKAFYGGTRLGGGSHWDADNLPQEPHVQAVIDGP